MPKRTFSIIVPVLNEAAGLAELAAHLAPFSQAGAQVLLVDGGSDDSTPELAQHAGFQVIRSERGRAQQMNAGAAHAQGNTLVFLHADTRLPKDALALISKGLMETHGWGRFDVHIAGRPAMLRVVAGMMNWRSRFTGIATGDQAMFMTREAFEAVGGFPVQPLMEDIEMSRRLRALSSPVCLRERVVTSGRRWETRGVWTTIVLMWRLRWAYWRGVAPAVLAQAYS
jgi:rSAM/selenodomain-associated transferase 2